MADGFEDAALAGEKQEEKIPRLEAKIDRFKKDAFVCGMRLEQARNRLATTQDRLDHAKLEARKRAGDVQMLVRTLKVVWALWESFAFTGSILERLREAAEDLDEDPDFLIATLQKYEVLSRSDPPMLAKIKK